MSRIGPRVIREMLAEHIRPENLPTGNTVETPAPIPGRRISTPIVKGRSGSAMSDPSRKPSRVRAAETAQAEQNRASKEVGAAKAKGDDAAFERAVNTPARGIGERTLDEVRRVARGASLSLWDAARQAAQGGDLAGRARNALAAFGK